MNHELEKFSEDTRLILEEIQKEQTKQEKRIQEMEKKLATLPDTPEIKSDELRQELITGIRLLGEKVSSALNNVNERFEKFSLEINEKIEQIESKQITNENTNGDEQFAKIKENKLLEESDFEIVPRDAISRLMELTKRQALAIKKCIDEQVHQLNGIEKKLKQNEEKITSFQILVSKKVKQNFIILLAIIAATFLIFTLIYIF